MVLTLLDKGRNLQCMLGSVCSPPDPLSALCPAQHPEATACGARCGTKCLLLLARVDKESRPQDTGAGEPLLPPWAQRSGNDLEPTIWQLLPTLVLSLGAANRGHGHVDLPLWLSSGLPSVLDQPPTHGSVPKPSFSLSEHLSCVLFSLEP